MNKQTLYESPDAGRHLAEVHEITEPNYAELALGRAFGTVCSDLMHLSLSHLTRPRGPLVLAIKEFLGHYLILSYLKDKPSQLASEMFRYILDLCDKYNLDSMKLLTDYLAENGYYELAKH